MARFLIAYSTTFGHTRKVADRIAERLQRSGQFIDVTNAAHPEVVAMESYDGFILAASVNAGKHQKSMVEFVRNHLRILDSKPSLFVSVSGAAASNDAVNQAEARKYIEAFEAETGLRPTLALPVAGEIAFTRYPWFMRMMLKLMVKWSGGEHKGDTDTRRDYVYTDWEALERAVDDFLRTHVPSSRAMVL